MRLISTFEFPRILSICQDYISEMHNLHHQTMTGMKSVTISMIIPILETVNACLSKRFYCPLHEISSQQENLWFPCPKCIMIDAWYHFVINYELRIYFFLNCKLSNITLNSEIPCLKYSVFMKFCWNFNIVFISSIFVSILLAYFILTTVK